MATPSAKPSIFLHPPSTISPSPTPVIVHLRRDQLHPIELNPAQTTPNETLCTRFGHFPHKTFLGVPSGSQIKSSLVGSDRKRKHNTENRGGGDDGETTGDTPTGFVHVLTPTPELWTISLPHRTQVVYTSDSSYILHRLRVRPGSRIIEAGAGSGSFTHAAVRGIYNGYPTTDSDPRGKVFSYEYHAPRAEKLREELVRHGLDGLVQITHGDVCKEGFRLQAVTRSICGHGELVEGVHKMDVGGQTCEKEGEDSPNATAVFLDLPAPWLAIPHLKRNYKTPTTPFPSPSPIPVATPSVTTPPPETTDQELSGYWGPLHPSLPVQICTFSPCIEQIHRTVSVLRKFSWTDCEMVEVQHRKLEVRRAKPGGALGADGAYANVEAAVNKLKCVADWRRRPAEENRKRASRMDEENSNKRKRHYDEEEENPVLTTRLESELKTHTSYLLFATLPPPWTASDEEAAQLRVEQERAKYVVERDTNGVSVWKKEKDAKRGKYGVPPPTEVDGSGVKKPTRKERKKAERAEKYKKEKRDQQG